MARSATALRYQCWPAVAVEHTPAGLFAAGIAAACIAGAHTDPFADGTAAADTVAASAAGTVADPSAAVDSSAVDTVAACIADTALDPSAAGQSAADRSQGCCRLHCNTQHLSEVCHCRNRFAQIA